MSQSHPTDLLRPRRVITGMSAVLLPLGADLAIDWDAFDAHVARTADAGLVPAVNMDTGWVHLLDTKTRAQVLGRTAEILAGTEISAGTAFVAGAFDEVGAAEVAAAGGTPILFPSPQADVVATYTKVAAAVERFLGFELSPVFHPDGAIWDLETYRAVMDIPQCVGAKHSSLRRPPEWERLRLRDARRPEFRVLTGNDLAIDMVIYGSDYLLGLSTMAPDLFARRDALWASGDESFYELNDALQDLGNLAFRPPVPAYRHSAAMFLRLRGWLRDDRVPQGQPARPESDRELLAAAGRRLGVL